MSAAHLVAGDLVALAKRVARRFVEEYGHGRAMQGWVNREAKTNGVPVSQRPHFAALVRDNAVVRRHGSAP